ncbi:MAG TPA: lipase maturation factor family protein [Gammaproteobacteria bacterium]|nr:lipase maturation factor family protein [Gammaproteobacteria bacterium]
MPVLTLPPPGERHELISSVFLRLLALIYLAAFVSAGVQIIGLVGSHGILPIAERIATLRAGSGWEGFWSLPTLLWLDAGDDALFAVVLAGCVFSVALFVNLWPRISLVALFVLYLSLFHAGQIFMNFQWHYLLLESGFAAIFLAGGARPGLWLLKWALFRVRFMSGLSKLASGDPTWAGLTALNYFFEVQPLPHWGGWYAAQLPEWMLRLGTGATLFIEILVPLTLFMPRWARLPGAWLTILMQVLILMTSNHAFLNLLVLVLCLFFFEDRDLRRVLPKPLTRWLTGMQPPPVLRRSPGGLLALAVAVLLIAVSLVQMAEMFTPWRSPQPVALLTRHLRPFQLVHRYHVFPTMKTERLELIIEGSEDGVEWRAYEFRYKPGDVYRKPEFIVPHHPQLDWIMWFVPEQPFFLPLLERFLYRLLENSAPVLDLLEDNPFPDRPPRYLRVELYRYRFADPETHAATGQWWQREYLGPFSPLPGLMLKKQGTSD